jgi:membrane protease YdiL (CAAX protease family)
MSFKTTENMRHKLNYISAICIGVLPVYIILIWYRLTHNEVFTVFDMLSYPLIFGGGNILLILALNKYLLKEKITDFNPGKGRWYWDILVGLVLAAIYFLLLFIERSTIANMLPQGKPVSQEVITMMTGLANNPILLAIWLGPVVWIGVAIFEELGRVFFLNCLWRLSNKKYWELIAVIFVSFFWGFAHLYQGAFGIISVSLQGLIMGFFYYKYRRILPLIISHALYDSIQVIMFVIQVS